MVKSVQVLFFIMGFSILAKSQVAKNSELFKTLKTHDSIFFERSFNRCDFEFINKSVHKDLAFYHDRSGFQNKNFFIENIRKYICSNQDKKPIRKVVAESLEVFPMYNNEILYGAIQNGIHEFYIREKNKEEVITGRARFTHLYLLENGQWLLKEVFSFDHNGPSQPEITTKFEAEIEELLIQEKVPALGLGIIENGKLKQIKVFGKIDDHTPISYNSIFKVASLTKPVTAMVALKLISEGKLGLDEALDKYWIDEDLKNDSRTKKLSPRIILSHQSGFPNWRYLTEKKVLSFQFEPGTRFQYSGEGFEYLRKAIEVKFGKKLEELADSLIFKPAKMNDTHFWWDKSMDESRYVKNYDKDGKLIETHKYYSANAAANLLTTVEDYGNFLCYVLNGGGLSPELFEEMTKNQVRLKENDYFALGWEKLTGFSEDEYALLHTGKDPGVNTLAVIFPKTKNGYLIFLNGDNSFKIWEELLTGHLYLGEELWNRK